MLLSRARARTHARMDGRTYARMDGRTYARMYARTHGRLTGWITCTRHTRIHKYVSSFAIVCMHTRAAALEVTDA